MRCLGLDLGSKTLGISISDRTNMIASVYTTLYFENEIKRPASGQSAVLYDGEICLGGGIIA